jgi:hypothetical protein
VARFVGIKTDRKKSGTRQSANEQQHEQDDVDSLLHSAIDIDQSIVLESALLQSNPAGSPSSITPLGTAPDPRLDQEARNIEGKALKQGELLQKSAQTAETPKSGQETEVARASKDMICKKNEL